MTQHSDVTVYIGRFNPFHLGHVQVLRRALATSKLVIVLVGSAGKARSPRNPFSFIERASMIEAWAASEGHDAFLRVVPVSDQASDTAWIHDVQSIVKRVTASTCKHVAELTGEQLVLTDTRIIGSDRDETTWYLNAFPQWRLDLVEPYRHEESLSGTSVRRVLFEEDPGELPKLIDGLSHKLPQTTIDFLQRFIKRDDGAIFKLRVEHMFIRKSKAAWAAAPYKPTFQTADAVIIQSGHVLVVKRGNQPGYGLWALPGGYVNQHETIRDAAIREAIEETGISLAKGSKSAEITARMLRGSIVDHEIFDNPNRSERGRIITCAYLIRLDDTKPLPTVAGQNVPAYEAASPDEVETLSAFWLPLSRAFDEPEMWFEDHLEILGHFVNSKSS